jgi:hypothetical protein
VLVLISQALSVLREAQAGWSKGTSGSGRPSAKVLQQRLHIVSSRLSGPAYKSKIRATGLACRGST